MPRSQLMKHLVQDNLAICIGRAGQVVGLEKPWNLVFCSVSIIDLNLFYRGGSANFPLYIYKDSGKKPNINPAVKKELTSAYGKDPSPEDILYYVYAVLHSNVYRTKFSEFLKTDYPKIPFTSDYELFKKIAEIGERLFGLHLLVSSELNVPVTKFQGSGVNVVEVVTYNNDLSRIQINESQYFEGIGAELWEYHVGGYQILLKWLKDRKGRILTTEEIKQYCRIVAAVQKTIETQQIMDALFLKVESSIIRFKLRTHVDLHAFLK